MDTLTAEKLEYLLSGYKVTMEDRDGIIDLMEGYAKQEVERAKVFSSNPLVIKSVCACPTCKSEEIETSFCNNKWHGTL